MWNEAIVIYYACSFAMYAFWFRFVGDIAAFYKIFQKVDTSGDGDIDVDELLVYLNIDMSKFAHRVFSMFDADKSGQIDFKEFVLCCWNYCTLGRATLVLFAFDLCKYWWFVDAPRPVLPCVLLTLTHDPIANDYYYYSQMTRTTVAK